MARMGHHTTVRSSLCFWSSMSRFLSPLIVLVPQDSNLLFTRTSVDCVEKGYYCFFLFGLENYPAQLFLANPRYNFLLGPDYMSRAGPVSRAASVWAGPVVM